VPGDRGFVLRALGVPHGLLAECGGLVVVADPRLGERQVDQAGGDPACVVAAAVELETGLPVIVAAGRV
jgi:hypothetical protein